MKRITDPTFRYTRAVDTDLKKTFARELRRLAEEKRKQEQADAEAVSKVRIIAKVKP